MSLRDFVICSGSAVTAAAGDLTVTNAAITANCVALGSFSTAVGAGSAAIQLRCVCAAGQAVFTAVNAGGAAVAAAVNVDYLVLNPLLCAVGSG